MRARRGGKDPKLAGKVAIKYVMGEDGTVKDIAVAQSTLPDQGVVGCATAVFRKLCPRESRGGA